MGNSKNLKLMTAIATGVLAGAVIGLLFAPAKGRETRTRLLNGAKDITGNLKQKIRGEGVETDIS